MSKRGGERGVVTKDNWRGSENRNLKALEVCQRGSGCPAWRLMYEVESDLAWPFLAGRLTEHCRTGTGLHWREART